jgi:organic radical activating enzyme
LDRFAVREIYYTLQGEGVNAGRPAVFCRFSGCNLWSGREEDRHKAICQFCDTNFADTSGPGGGVFSTADELAAAIERTWTRAPQKGDCPNFRQYPVVALARSVAGENGTVPFDARRGQHRLAVFTGGEPLLQLTAELVDHMHRRGFEVAVETNGTQLPPPGIDWICVSPKAHAGLRLRYGNELKLVFPQEGGEPQRYEDLDFQHFFLQPMDGPNREQNARLAIEYCLAHPRWRLSLQTQKVLGIP